MPGRSESRLLALFGRFDELGLAFEVRPGAGGERDPTIANVEFDSRHATQGSLFCCVPGLEFDGHDFAEAALAGGSKALLVERFLPLDVVQVRVRAVRPAMAHVAAAFHGHPSEQLDVVGITGTNGKTTIAALLQAVAAEAGRSAQVIGTLGGPRTTPESPELQALLANSVARGDAIVAMEVSSHSLDQSRVDGTHFAVAVFTNLTEDHLDYHRSMDEYFAAKARLFEPSRTDMALINTDDPYGRRLLRAGRVAARGFSSADAEILESSARGSRFVWRDLEVALPLAGQFNVVNAVAAGEVAVELGIHPEIAAAGLAACAPIPGRFQVIAESPFTVIVDYAHTPDALTRALETARTLAGEARVIVVFGAGGERDHEKRPLMGAAATAADEMIVTSDNPRSESPASIIADVVSGLPSGTANVIADRREAIGFALAQANPGDVVLIAGKGHETTQTVGDEVLDFDDRTVARALLEDSAR